jgi:hypothetical protein
MNTLQAGDNLSDLRATSFPRQKISRKNKTQDWREQCVDAVIYMCNHVPFDRRSPARRKKRNYDLFNNKIDQIDFRTVTNPFNRPTEEAALYTQPATLQPYDVLSPNFMLLFGEESKRMFTPIVRAVNEDSTVAKLELQKTNILSALQEHLVNSISNPADQEAEAILLKQLEKYSTYSPKDLRESQAQHLLTYLMKHERLSHIFMNGWKDALIAGEEIYRIDQVANNPKAVRVNPLEIFFTLPDNCDYIDEAEQIYERNKMSVSAIVDEFYEDLTSDQIDDLEKFYTGNQTVYNYGTLVTNEMYFGTPDGPITSGGVNSNYGNFNTVNSITDFQDINSRSGVVVHRTRWKSKRKQGIFSYLDPQTREPREMLVDELFKFDKFNPDQSIKWIWINEYWEGIRIGQDMYLPISPRKNQFRNVGNLSECKSGYVGTIYNALNSQSISLMDRLVPWLYIYLVLWYRTELLIAANQGKIAKMDLDLVPDGWEMDKWLHYATSMKFAFVSSFNEGKKGAASGKLAGQMSPQSGEIDLETGNSIQHNISLLQFIEQKIEDTAGVSRQRKGDISASELVGNTERAVAQSSHITEDWFRIHNFTKVRALEALIKVAQDCIEDGSKAFQYVTDDMQTIFSQIDGREFSDADYEVFVTDSIKDQEALQIMKQSLQAALQADKVDFSMVAEALTSESIADIKNKLKQAEAQKQQMLQQQQEQELQVQQQAHQEEMAMRQQELDLQKYKIDQDNLTKIQIAEMQAFAIDEGANPDQIADTGELALKQHEILSKEYTEQRKLEHERQIKEKELSLQRQEMHSKENIEKLKIKQTQIQNENQLELANKKAKLDKEMAEKKLAIERIKARRKPSSGK